MGKEHGASRARTPRQIKVYRFLRSNDRARLKSILSSHLS
jgi:hypothetical protein